MKEKLVFFRNAVIFTADPEQPYADWMAVCGDRIAGIGSGCGTKEAIACMEEADEVRDLYGASVMPGFVDAHMHPIVLAECGTQIAVLPPEINSIEDLKRRIAEERIRLIEGRNAENSGAEDSKESQTVLPWILGWGYDEGKLSEHRAPDRYDLDAASPDIPVAITRSCQHIRSVNSAALKLAGITKETRDPEGGVIDRDENREPTGILIENARNLILPFLPEKTEEKIKEEIIGLGKLLSSQGVTSICDMGNLYGPEDYFPLYEEAAAEGFPQNVRMYYLWDFYAGDPDFTIPKERRNAEKQISAAGLKLISDGSVSGRSAYVSLPYIKKEENDKEEYGISVLSDALLSSAVEFCEKEGLQLSVHAMGGRAIDRILSFMKEKESWTDEAPFVRIEHVTEPSREAMQLAAKKGIAFVTQPDFLFAEIESYYANLGPERTYKSYPVRTMLEYGVPLSFSTDAPATSWAKPSDPFPVLKSAVTRKAFNGWETGQEETIDISTALCLYTREAAKAAGFRDRGILKKGMAADFLILNDDPEVIPAERLTEIRPVETWISGKCVFRAEK